MHGNVFCKQLQVYKYSNVLVVLSLEQWGGNQGSMVFWIMWLAPDILVFRHNTKKMSDFNI